ncbi:gamma-glutamyl-gamma-aminobutyrate hydrolase family protein [Filibacter tadaridae]|uniref:Glutamine amidotransferase n=1 Tax=Filibacter tadaridae TaxID=2483811 RepID=A0A3P5WW50_9BACL|nr:gamma-glutamyl-gamma-aminobutyrate hydrolase family protein [Filibacter tadaridae]VDC27582.1 Putative glutamine amidotransferase [Filibacter tadaridae]
MKPIIGITCHNGFDYRHELNNDYILAVRQAGGFPLLVPLGMEKDVLQLSGILDGLLLSGGSDTNPFYYDEEPHPKLGGISPGRDSNEIEIIQKMLALNKPILGICRGHQILNVTLEGNMYQDIHAQQDHVLLQHVQQSPRNQQSHYVQVNKETILASIAGAERISVNSFHHQAVKNVPEPLIVSGVASDGIIEAVESVQHDFVMGVQWHPEALATAGDEVSVRLFERFINACKAEVK